jgi:hypothetical protein
MAVVNLTSYVKDLLHQKTAYQMTIQQYTVTSSRPVERQVKGSKLISVFILNTYFCYVKCKVNRTCEIQTLQTALLYSRWPSSVIRQLFIQIQFSGNALGLIVETGENDISDMFI